MAREFNKVTRLENVDKWVSGFTTRINTINQEVKILEGQLEGQRKELEEYDDLPDIERVVRKAERIEGDMNACEENAARVKKSIGELSEVEDAMSDCRGLAKAVGPVERCLKLLEELEDKERDIRSVRGRIDKLQAIEDSLARYEEKSDALPFVEKALALCDSVRAKAREIDRVGRLLHGLEDLDVEMRRMERSGDDSMREYVSVLKRLKRCPTCFREVDADTLDRIVEGVQG